MTLITKECSRELALQMSRVAIVCWIVNATWKHYVYVCIHGHLLIKKHTSSIFFHFLSIKIHYTPQTTESELDPDENSGNRDTCLFLT